MAPTEGRVANPDRRWGCRRGGTRPWNWKAHDQHYRWHPGDHLPVPGTFSDISERERCL